MKDLAKKDRLSAARFFHAKPWGVSATQHFPVLNIFVYGYKKRRQIMSAALHRMKDLAQQSYAKVLNYPN